MQWYVGPGSMAGANFPKTGAIMGDYITQTDLEDVFGETNVAAWSDMEGNREVDTNRVTKAIAWGESKVVATLRRSKYVVPLQAASG